MISLTQTFPKLVYNFVKLSLTLLTLFLSVSADINFIETLIIYFYFLS